MRLKIVKDRENPLLERKEMIIKIIHEKATPSRKEVRSKIIAELGLDKDSTIVDKMVQKFGSREVITFVKVYKTKEKMLEVEDKSKIKKNFEESN